MTMDYSFPQMITSISWILSEAVGICAALQAGAQGGATGELPFADLLSAVSKEEPLNGISGENVFIGIESQWLRMMLRSFQTRQLKFVYLLLREHSYSTKCSYIPEEQAKGMQCIVAVKPPNCTIGPNMFFGLMNSDEVERGDEVVVHRSHCLLGKPIDMCATEFLFLPERLGESLKKPNGEYITSKKALLLCRSIINSMSHALCNCGESNFWDMRIIVRIQELIDILSKHSPGLNYNVVAASEVLELIRSQVPAMLERLELYEFMVDGVTYTIREVEKAFIICLGIIRATIMSDYIYKHGGVVFMGCDVNIAHELVEDLFKMPVGGYASRFVPESTARKRLVDEKVRCNYVFYGLLLDVTLSTSIMLLSGLGPIVSMFVARKLSAPYREGTMHMGTCMSWAVSGAMILNTGDDREDWMACILPPRHTLDWFTVLSMASSFGPPLLWIFYHPPASSISRGGWVICIVSVAFGLSWLLLSNSIEKEKLLENPMVIKQPFDDYTHKPRCNPVYLCALAVIAPLALFSMDLNWVWLYILELAYSLQWLYGEVSSQWMHKGTALFMLGMLGAVRLYELV